MSKITAPEWLTRTYLRRVWAFAHILCSLPSCAVVLVGLWLPLWVFLLAALPAAWLAAEGPRLVTLRFLRWRLRA